MATRRQETNVKRTLNSVCTLLVAASVLLTGCSADDSTDARSNSTATGSDLEGSITVAAATSLTDAFEQIASDFAALHPGVGVTFTFDSSSIVATQILAGAPADVFASADEANMAKLTDEGLIAGEPEVFARNDLTIITKPGNPQGITSLADLADAGVISLCGEAVPCGRYATEALDAAGVSIPESRVTRGQNAGATLTAVAEGDAVAGIVYRTDAQAAGDTVSSVALPAEHKVIARYPIGVLEASDRAEVAEAFAAYVLSDDGQATLASYGFQGPG